MRPLARVGKYSQPPLTLGTGGAVVGLGMQIGEFEFVQRPVTHSDVAWPISTYPLLQVNVAREPVLAKSIKEEKREG